jgi:hypothetical protein
METKIREDNELIIYYKIYDNDICIYEEQIEDFYKKDEFEKKTFEIIQEKIK